MTRRRDESILVDRHIEITVVEIRGDKVRLGITAPKEVPVHRREVFEAIHGADAFRSAPCASDSQAAGEDRADELSSIDLTRRQLAILDRLCESIGAHCGAAPRREQALGAILSAIHEAEESVREPLTLAHLQASLASAIKATAASK